MRKLYEDDYVIAVDTENGYSSCPIHVMYEDELKLTSYLKCYKDFKRKPAFSNMVIKIIEFGRELGIYKKEIEDCNRMNACFAEELEMCDSEMISEIKRRIKYYEDILKEMMYLENENLDKIKEDLFK